MDAAAAVSIVEIQQLAHRYSLAVDSRDMDLLVGLFVPDVRVGPDRHGRDELRRWYIDALRAVGFTIHMVGNHIVDLDLADGDRASGVVYCREEFERRDTGERQVGMIQYWDSYRRVHGSWYFERRRVRRWYLEDMPASSRRLGDAASPGHGPQELSLPEAFPTWAAFWASPGGDGSDAG